MSTETPAQTTPRVQTFLSKSLLIRAPVPRNPRWSLFLFFCVQKKGAPAGAQRSGSGGERRKKWNGTDVRHSRT